MFGMVMAILKNGRKKKDIPQVLILTFDIDELLI